MKKARCERSPITLPAVGCVVCIWAASVAGCGGARRMPSGPPPEYERPAQTEWSAPRQTEEDRLDSLIENARISEAGASGASAGQPAAEFTNAGQGGVANAP